MSKIPVCSKCEHIQCVCKPTFAVGASVLLTNEYGRLLLAKRKNNSGAGLLSTPGGRVEYDDASALEAACREFREECGAQLVHPVVIGCKKHFRFGKHYFMFYIHASVWFGDSQQPHPGQVRGLGLV